MQRSRRSVKKSIIEESSSEDEHVVNNINEKNENVVHDKENSSSESDIENYLQPINKIDLSSSFFNLNKNSNEVSDTNQSKIPHVSKLSDSSEESNDDSVYFENRKKCETERHNLDDTFKTSFHQMEEFKRKMEETKKQVERYNEKRKSQGIDNSDSKKGKKPILDLDISDLLAFGESKKALNLENIRKEDLHSSDFESSDEDWEEVHIKENQEVKEKIEQSIPKEGIQITIGSMPENVKKKKTVDFLAAMKRRLNRIRKENQVYVHKVHLLCWIAHGNYVNGIVNSSDILSQALTLLPSDKCYPSDRTDLGYLEKIVQWYKKTVVVIDKPVPKKLDLMSCLQLQMARKQAFNNRMYVFIFTAILRALGIQTRIVISFQVEPLRPPQRELHSLAKDHVQKNKDKNKPIKKDGLAKDIKKKSETGSSSSKHKQELNTSVIKNSSLTTKNEDSIKSDKKKQDNDNKKSANPKDKRSSLRNQASKEKSSKHDANTDETNSRKRVTVKPKTEVVNKIPKLEGKRRSTRKIPQVDGWHDSSENSDEDNVHYLPLLQVDGPSDVKNRSLKTNLKKLNKPDIEKKNVKEKITRKVTKKTVSIPKSQSEDSEEEFILSPNKSVHSPTKISQVTPKGQFDVKNVIINLIKGRITEQKHVTQSRIAKKRSQRYADSDSDSDYAPEPIKKKHHDSDNEYFVPKPKVKKRIRVKKEGNSLKVISSESDLDESGKMKRKCVNVWVEVFLEAEEKWISADIVKGQVHCVNEIYARTTHPVSYIVAWKNDNSLKDVTRRYCKNFSTVTRKLRVESKWWEETLKPFIGCQTIRDKEEDDDLNRQQLDQPMPKAILEYKNHPLYALKRHLLKFEAIYPDDQIPLGYVRGEAVYPRNSVYVCKSRDIWLKEALVVKPGEKPYKIVKARPKYDKLSNTVITDQMLEIFGPWQTMDYEPPTAENGIVPRNAFGNVELFKPCMLPKGTVHITLAGLNKVCKKLKVDCASAIVGFDFHGGWSHPVYDGFVICEEFADTVIATWELEQEEMERKETEKIEQRVYGNWKKLIKGLLIRERLKAKYDFGEPSTKSADKSKKTKKSQHSKKRRKSNSSNSE